jgi:hypothetical protein
VQQPLPFLFLASTPRPVVAPPYSTSFAGRGRCWRAPSAAGAPSRASFAGRRSAALEFCRSGTPLASVALELRRSRALLASPAGRRTRALQELTGGVAVAELLGGARAGAVVAAGGGSRWGSGRRRVELTRGRGGPPWGNSAVGARAGPLSCGTELQIGSEERDGAYVGHGHCFQFVRFIAIYHDLSTLSLSAYR